jgi:hypothetical protein
VKILQRMDHNHSGGQGENPLTQRRYLIGLSLIFASAYSQYLVIGFGTLFALLIVYGVPISVVSFLFGSAILRRAFNHTRTALKWGMALFGISSLGGILGASAVFSVIVMFDPKASYLLHKPNPVLQVPPEYAWIMVWLSLVLVGPAEEYVFRGFVYGGLLHLSQNRHWLSLAFFPPCYLPWPTSTMPWFTGLLLWPLSLNYWPSAWGWRPPIISQGEISSYLQSSMAYMMLRDS